MFVELTNTVSQIHLATREKGDSDICVKCRFILCGPRRLVRDGTLRLQ